MARAIGEIEHPDDADVRAELERIVGSDTFVASPRLASFLRYVVETTLAGHGGGLKGYTVGVEALGRREDFDPQTDPIVRVEAGRLRHALARYYAGDGSDDPVVIELPRGRYVPTFRHRGFPLGLGHLPFSVYRSVCRSLHESSRRVAAVAIFTALVGVVLVAAQAVWTRGITADVTAALLPAGNAGRPVGDLFPVVDVEPFSVVGPGPDSPLAHGDLRIMLRDALARFEEVTVVTTRLQQPGADRVPLPSRKQASRIDYRVSGLLDYRADGTLSPTMRLIDNTEGTVVWVRTFQPIRANAGSSEIEREIVRRPVTALAQPNGVIQARERTTWATGATIDPRYGCLLDNNMYRLSYDPTAHERVKGCLTQATAGDPHFALGFAALARVYVRQHYHKFGQADDAVRPLDRARLLALRAVQIDPESATAHLALMATRFARREFSTALESGQMAIALNPYDMLALADYGVFLIRLGKIEQGVALVREAVANGYAPTPRSNFALSLAAYVTGDFVSARHYAEAIATETFPSGLCVQALAAAKAGDVDRARSAIRRLVAVQPSWQTDARRELAKAIPDQAIGDRLAADLAAIGLGTTY